MSDAPLFDQAVVTLQELSREVAAAAGRTSDVALPTVGCWANTLETAVADLLEVQRRARYDEVFAMAAALVDVTIEGPPPAARHTAASDETRAPAPAPGSSQPAPPMLTRT